MNENRKEKINFVIDELIDRFAEIRMEAIDKLSAIRDEEEEDLINLPEELQGSEESNHMQNCINELEFFMSDLDSMDIDTINLLNTLED